jgi:hypothetical protein
MTETTSKNAITMTETTPNGASELRADAQDVTRPLSATETPSEAPEGPQSAETDVTEQLRALRAEAKQHRLARRAAESERDQLRVRVDQADRLEVERLAGDRLQNPADLWLTSAIADFRDEDGQLDAEKVSERVDAVLAERPHWRTPAADFGSGVRKPIQRPASLGEAFKQSIRGR